VLPILKVARSNPTAERATQQRPVDDHREGSQLRSGIYGLRDIEYDFDRLSKVDTLLRQDRSFGNELTGL